MASQHPMEWPLRPWLSSSHCREIEKRHDISVEEELAKLANAIGKTKEELNSLYETANEKMGGPS
jgi:hypothetical protein